jgi:nitrous oxidase accessory protein
MPFKRYSPAAFMAAGFFSALSSGLCLADVVTVTPGTLAVHLAAATDGDTLLLASGTHRGPIVIERSITVRGEDGAVIDGGGEGTVITVAAPKVRLENLTISGSGQNYPLKTVVYSSPRWELVQRLSAIPSPGT